MNASQRPIWKIALVLGLLTALGPLATDLYLPALPQMEASLGADTAGVQLTLVVYFIGFGLAQLIWGPLSDRLGRRPVLLAGAGLFAAASIGCVITSGLNLLILLRLLQAIGAAALMVVPRAVVTDLFEGSAAAKLMGVIMIITAASPLLAPLAGSGLLLVTEWRGIFAVMAAVGAVAFVATLLLLPESAKDLRRASIAATAKHAGKMLRDPVFLSPALASAFGFAAFAILIVSAPFVFADIYGLSPTEFALAFAAIAFGFVIAAGAGGALADKIGERKTLSVGLAIYALAAFSATILALFGLAPLWLAIASLFGVTLGLGLVVPISTILALGPQGGEGGLASSVLGALQMLVGAVAAGLLGIIGVSGSLVWMAGAILLAAICAWVSYSRVPKTSHGPG